MHSKLNWLVLLLALSLNLQAQEHLYVPPLEPEVQQQLEEWQDWKFGLMMHWGIYSQWGIVESWALCSEDQPFQDRGGVPYTEFKEKYFGLIEEFNPQLFNPDKWAAAAADAGMKYVVFTTKHHDGFSMWDTRQSDFRITSERSPFHRHSRADIAGEIFRAFRKEGLGTGAYFSKADWHHPAYWSPLWATPDRNNNYDIRKYPELWKEFKDFTFAQIKELMTKYGEMDILWLDAGWVRPDSTINEEVRSWGYDIPEWEQDIDMPALVSMARSYQPEILVVDRTVHGPYENYRTPEQQIPDSILPYPWETCMTLSQSWGYNAHARYKTTEQVIHYLVDIVSKGGNYLLNVGPRPDGEWDPEAYQRLEEIGEWLKINGCGIYQTRPWKVHGQGENIRYTLSAEADTLNVFVLDPKLNALELKNIPVKAGAKIRLAGKKANIPYTLDQEKLQLRLPESKKENEADSRGRLLRIPLKPRNNII